MFEFPVFIINLDDSPDRLDDASKLMADQNARFTRISGYNGRKTNPHDVPEYDAAATTNYIGRDLNGGEIGCFFSHVRAVKAFVETGADFGLVLEDDMRPLPGALKLVSKIIERQIKQGQPDWYVANLGANRMKIVTPVEEISIDGFQSTIYRAHYFPMLATALLWSRAGALEFLEKCLPMDCPFDFFMRRWLMENDMGLTLDPPLFTTTGATSVIDTSHTSKQRSHERRIPSYRWLKIKRMFEDRIRALRHKLRHRVMGKGPIG